jgi:hypothetical protein
MRPDQNTGEEIVIAPRRMTEPVLDHLNFIASLVALP